MPQLILTRKLSQYAPFNDSELSAIGAIPDSVAEVAAHSELSREGKRGKCAYIVVDGWTYTYRLLEDGSRQIINFHLPGDFLGLRSVLLRTIEYSSATLIPCRMAMLDRSRLEQVYQEHPRIGMGLLWTAARDEAMLVERLVSLGRRSAHERTAHLLCELGYRLNALDLAAAGDSFQFPIPQVMLADALGLSTVHLNRSLRALRERGFVERRAGTLHVLDLKALQRYAGFDDEYLDIGFDDAGPG